MTKPLPSIRIFDATDLGGGNIDARAADGEKRTAIRIMGRKIKYRPNMLVDRGRFFTTNVRSTSALR